jgi:hypothetical protein
MTDMEQSDGAILRTDVQGRVRTPAARRESLLDEFERSGLSGAKFAALAGIKYQTFAAWAARRRQQGVAKGAARPAHSVRWLEAVVREAQAPEVPNPGRVVLRLPCGSHLEVADLKQVPLAAALVRALAEPRPAC